MGLTKKGLSKLSKKLGLRTREEIDEEERAYQREDANFKKNREPHLTKEEIARFKKQDRRKNRRYKNN